MKQKWNKYKFLILVLEVFLIAMFLLLLIGQEVHAAETDLQNIEATAYCEQGFTASGSFIRSGICAGKKDWIGKTAIIYTPDWEFIGMFEVLDTGGDYRIQEGNCIDIWLPTYDAAREFGRQKVRVQIVDAEG